MSENSMIYEEQTMENIWSMIKEGFITLLDKMNISNEPIYVLIIIALIAGIFIIYDKDNENSRLVQSLSSCWRRLGILFFDVVGDIVSIFSSLTEIFNLVKILVFGKVDSQTQTFLANYAIIFLSVVSYYTSYSGLAKVLDGWSAILCSFGIQVGILVFSSRLAVIIADTFEGKKEKKTYYRIKDMYKSGQNDDLEGNKQKDNKGKSSVSIVEKGIVIGCLGALISCSSFFSYNSFYKKFVIPVKDFDEYASVMVNVSEIEATYSKELKGYQQELEEILYSVNNLIADNVDLMPVKKIDEHIANLELDLEELRDKLQDEILREDEVPEEEREFYYDQIDMLEVEIADVEEELEEENTIKEESYLWSINDKIEKLSYFYANPLSEETTVEEINKTWGDLQAAITQIDELKGLFTLEQKSALDSVMSNYLKLCDYYRKNNYVGFRYRVLDKSSQTENISNSLSVDDRYDVGKILENAIISLEQAPDFESISGIFDNKKIEETSKTELLDDLYVDYRNTSEKIEELEKGMRALINLISFRKKTRVEKQANLIVLFLMLLAVFLDLTIVLLSIWRGKRTINRNISEARRLVGILFIREEKEKTAEEKRLHLSVALGLLFGVLLFVVNILIPSGGGVLEGEAYWEFFLYCGCGVLVAIVIGKAIGISESKVNPLTFKKNDENENKEESILAGYLHEGIASLLKETEVKTVLTIDKENANIESEREAFCIEVKKVNDSGLNIEFSILKSYQLIVIADGYYIFTDVLWRMLYTNVLGKMSGDLVIPLNMEDIMSYEDDGNDID